MPTIIYLHGFASSPYGTKSHGLRAYVEDSGADYLAPDLNVPTFETLTVTAMIAAVDQSVRQAPSEPVYLVGSSLGGFVALHYLDQHQNDSAQHVAKLLLLAPAIHNRWVQTPEYAEWERTGSLPIKHYGYNGNIRQLHFGFMVDHRQYDTSHVQPRIPIHILHGEHDELIPVSSSRDFAVRHPQITLQVLNTDHQMHDQMPAIWGVMRSFFELS